MSLLARRGSLLTHRCLVANSVRQYSYDDEYSPEKMKLRKEYQWRTPWQEKKDHFVSKLKVFSSQHNNVETINFVRQPVNLSPSAIKAWWKKKKLREEIALQQYLPDRNEVLGNELAAGHFLLYKGGKVKYYGKTDWEKMKDDDVIDLPNKFDASWKLEAIDCQGVPLHYEGLENFRKLDNVKWLSLQNCVYMDDWCMDRVASYFEGTLQYLDLRGCVNVSERGLGALYKLEKLETLLVDDPKASVGFELTCLMMQQLNPRLKITTVP